MCVYVRVRESVSHRVHLYTVTSPWGQYLHLREVIGRWTLNSFAVDLNLLDLKTPTKRNKNGKSKHFYFLLELKLTDVV